MKICACIAEYNPFHYGHLKHIEYMKNTLKADKIIVVMSGNFTQRGEPAVLDKFTRAKHAVLSGADVVIELPTPFAVGNAETFATGAINLICNLGIVDGICFGVESGTKENYVELATAMNNESKEFKKILKGYLDQGISLAKAKFLAVKDFGDERFDESLISSPNNILALEYTKALLRNNSSIEIFPLLRDGDHNDENLKKGITSAKSIRNMISENQIKKVKKNVPNYVYDDLTSVPSAFNKMILTSALTTPTDQLALCPDCTEGLENRIKALLKDNKDLNFLISKVSTKRYTESRIRRILIANLLGIKRSFVAECIESPLYAKILAVSSTSKDVISSLGESSFIPLLTRKTDVTALKKTALKCFEIDTLANDLYGLATDKNINENQMLII